MADHQDIEGNEKADSLARTGSLNSAQRTTTVNSPVIYLKGKIKEEFDKKFKERWENNNGCKITKKIWPDISSFKYKWISLKKMEPRRLIGSVTGHWMIGKHAKRLNLVTSDNCRFCKDAEEDIQHIFCEYPATSWRRKMILGSFFFEDLDDMTLHRWS